MRTLFVTALLALAAQVAHALPTAKTLAQFDLGYSKCESRFDKMKGFGDEAYLALWKIKPDAKQRAELARQRKSAAYKQARTEAMKKMAKDSPELEQKLTVQCEGTWAELQNNRASAKAAPPAASGTASKPKK